MSKSDHAEEQKQDGLGESYNKVSTKVAAAYASARERTAGAGEALEASPLAALLGGIAVGALAGALIPRLEREKDLLGPLGARIGDAARAAFDAGRQAGVGALDEAGLTPDQLRGQVSELVEKALKAASTAGSAAIEAARKGSQGQQD